MDELALGGAAGAIALGHRHRHRRPLARARARLQHRTARHGARAQRLRQRVDAAVRRLRRRDRVEEGEVVRQLQVLADERRVGHAEGAGGEVVALEQVGESVELDELVVPERACSERGERGESDEGRHAALPVPETRLVPSTKVRRKFIVILSHHDACTTYIR